MHALPALLAVLIVAATLAPAAAQTPEFPTDCTEAMTAGNVFIGHDCGEWASVLISGNILIRKPWSRANRANRGVRLRLRREAGNAPTPASQPGTGTVTVEVHCKGSPERTIIRNGTNRPITLIGISSIYQPGAPGETSLSALNRTIPAQGEWEVQTGRNADTSTGGIKQPIYEDNHLSEEGAVVTTSVGTFRAPCQ
jgi:hypothetical protein